MNRGVVIHPTGNRNVREVVRACVDAQQIEAFFTAIDGGRMEARLRWLPGGVHREFKRRDCSLLKPAQVYTVPWRELARLALTKAGFPPRRRSHPCSVDAVYRAVDRQAAGWILGTAEPPAFVYAYEDGAVASFQAAAQRGVRRIYDLPIAYFETGYKLMSEEAVRYPEWAPTLGFQRDPPEKLERKREELALADVVMCASGFVLDSLPPEVRATKDCRIAPFGCDMDEASADAPPVNGPLKILFVGRLTQRKGLADVFAALRLLNDPRRFELHLLGSMEAPASFYRGLGVPFHLHAVCPRPEVLRTMASCHVLVLPSIVEGRALVQLEALAQGLPLLVTRNAGGEDLIDEGRTGHLVSIRDPETLAARLESMARDLPATLAMRDICREKARAVSWTHYRRLVLEAILSKEEN